MLGPRTGCSLGGGPNILQRLEPAIRRGLKANLPPNSFLRIQPWLVRRQVIQMQALMGTEELLHGLSLVPAGTVYIEPDRVTAEPAVEVSQHFHKALAISSHRRDHATPSQQRSDPTGKIQPGVMATGGRKTQPLARFRPASSQSGMQAETGLVLKNHRLMPTQAGEFFLEPAGTCEHLRHGLAGRCSWRVSSGNPTDASSILEVDPVEIQSPGVH